MDAENSCGVCGESLSRVTSERIEQLVHREQRPEIRRKDNLNLGAIALIIVALTTMATGAYLLVLLNVLGVFLLLPGLVIVLYLAGGAGSAAGGSGGGWRRGGRLMMREAETRQKEEERKRRTGEND